jgi:hypothetical protein
MFSEYESAIYCQLHVFVMCMQSRQLMQSTSNIIFFKKKFSSASVVSVTKNGSLHGVAVGDCHHIGLCVETSHS